jgi:hypothetical protein
MPYFPGNRPQQFQQYSMNTRQPIYFEQPYLNAPAGANVQQQPQQQPQQQGQQPQQLPQPQQGQMPPNYLQIFGFRSPEYRGTHLGNAGSNFLNSLAVNQLGNFFGAADRVADSVNSGYDALRQSMTNAAERQMFRQTMNQRERMFNRLSAALLGGGGGMGGIYDTNSNLRVGSPSVSTNITARPLSMSSILSADNQMRNSPLQNYSPGRNMSPQGQMELNQLLQAQVRDSVPNAERALIDANEPFARSVQSARSNQFASLASLLTSLQGDQIDNRARNLPYLLQMMS